MPFLCLCLLNTKGIRGCHPLSLILSIDHPCLKSTLVRDVVLIHEEDADISPTVNTDSAVVDNGVVQEKDSAVDSETDLVDNAPEIPDDQFSDIESMKLLLPDWHQNMVEFFRTGGLPVDRALSDKVKRDAWQAMVEELKDEALQNLMTYQDSMKRSYDKKLRARVFKPGDWVLRIRQRSNEEPNSGKLGEN
ncbi:hypothetical protein IFM89_008089 [Coptis chinensis]|uniref:Uncharacterized protein n=1 Tax=Coptis chinensis TaxID=261450 RepID=A0A835IU50_9MAGN|nr:hypothetical protein IFM89_008089 [Coptis chinensis]